MSSDVGIDAPARVAWDFTVTVSDGRSTTSLATGQVVTTGDDAVELTSALTGGQTVAAAVSGGRVVAGAAGQTPSIDLRVGKDGEQSLRPDAASSLVAGAREVIETNEEVGGATYAVASQALLGVARQGQQGMLVTELWTDPGSKQLERVVSRAVASLAGKVATLTTTISRSSSPPADDLLPALPPAIPAQALGASASAAPVAGCTVAKAEQRWRLTCPDGGALEVDPFADPASLPPVGHRSVAATGAVRQADPCGAAGALHDAYDTFTDYEPLIEPMLGYFTTLVVLSGGPYVDAILFEAAALSGLLEVAVAAAILALAVLAIGCLASSAFGGDPHLVTVDGQRYDFQASGEFVSYASPSLTVQSRYEHAGDPSISYATAVAARVGSHTVQVLGSAIPDSEGRIPATVDGAAALLDARGTWFDDGGFVGRGAGPLASVVAMAPDRSFLRARLLPHSLDVELGLRRDAAGAGLLGTPNGSVADDFTLRSGEVLPAADALTVDGLYGRFGESWRVEEGERLFTDGTWADHRTPEDLAPPEIRSLAEFADAQRADAVAECVGAGVPVGAAAEACAFDVLATGDAGWADDAALAASGDGSGVAYAVPATADLYAAGLPAATAGGHGGTAPIRVEVDGLSGGSVVRFPSVTGRTDCCGGRPTSSADGAVRATDVEAAGGIAGYKDDHALGLVAVFLGDGPPTDPAPPPLDFTGNHAFTRLRPRLAQPFAVGNGRTAAGVVQAFVAPKGATRLFIGFADAPNFFGPPGSYDDNAGQLRAVVQVGAG